MFTAIDSNKNKIDIDQAQKDEQYFCEICEGAVIQKKRGKKKAPHFAHKVKNPYCDSWHSDMSEWHHLWQQKFPPEMREQVIEKDGVKHRADILINDTVLEFQHSYITAEDYENRNNFYNNAGYKVIWLFDIQEYIQKGQIVLIKSDSLHRCDRYKWNWSKSLFHGYDYEATDITIFFQFGSAECGKKDIKRLLKFDSDGFFLSDSKNTFDVPGFVTYVINGLPDKNSSDDEKRCSILSNEYEKKQSEAIPAKPSSTKKATSKDYSYCCHCYKHVHIEDMMQIGNTSFYICHKCIELNNLDWRKIGRGEVNFRSPIPKIISSCDYGVIILTNTNNGCSVKIGANQFRSKKGTRIYGYLKENKQNSYRTDREEIVDADKPIWVLVWAK